MRPFDVFSADCPSRAVLDSVLGRWGALVLLSLRDDPRRFADAARSVGGISDRMLSRTLRDLESQGFVLRTAQPGRQRVEYSLTDSGRDVVAALSGVVDSVYRAMPGVLANGL